MRYQGYSHPSGVVDEMESSSCVEIDRTNPALYCDCSDLPSLTRQEFADECDINKLMAQYEKTGILPSNINSAQPRYLDVSDVPDLRTAMDHLHNSTAAFMALPASVRKEFDNDPLKFVDFAVNSENIEQMRKWGLAPPAPLPPAPQEVVIIPTDEQVAEAKRASKEAHKPG